MHRPPPPSPPDCFEPDGDKLDQDHHEREFSLRRIKNYGSDRAMEIGEHRFIYNLCQMEPYEALLIEIHNGLVEAASQIPWDRRLNADDLEGVIDDRR